MSITKLLEAWDWLKGSKDLKDITEGPVAQALEISFEVDRMIKEYRGKVSDARKKQMTQRLEEIQMELETMLTVSTSLWRIEGARGSVKKATIALSAIQGAEFARLELVRIWWAIEQGHLPMAEPSKKAKWLQKRQAYLRILPFYRTFASQMAGAAVVAEREISQARKNQGAAREAVAEVRRQNERDAVEQLRMLQQDSEGFMSDERAATLDRDRFLAVRTWALGQDQRIRDLISAGNELFLAN